MAGRKNRRGKIKIHFTFRNVDIIRAELSRVDSSHRSGVMDAINRTELNAGLVWISTRTAKAIHKALSASSSPEARDLARKISAVVRARIQRLNDLGYDRICPNWAKIEGAA